MDYGPFAIEHVGEVTKTWGEVWSLWLSGKSIDREWILYGWIIGPHAVYWWIRLGCLLQFISVGLIILEVVGPERLKSAGSRLHTVVNAKRAYNMFLMAILSALVLLGVIIAIPTVGIIATVMTILQRTTNEDVVEKFATKKIRIRMALCAKSWKRNFHKFYWIVRPIERIAEKQVTSDAFEYALKKGFLFVFITLFIALIWHLYFSFMQISERNSPDEFAYYNYMARWVFAIVLIAPILAGLTIASIALLGILLDLIVFEVFAYILEIPILEVLIKILTVFLVIIGFVLAMMDV